MIVNVANISKKVVASDFNAAIAAIGRQVTEDFQPEWGITAQLKGVAVDLAGQRAPIQGNHDAIIYLGDASQDPTTGVEGALGYHSRNHGKIPYGFVYLDICKKYGESWSCTLSHEVLELLADPSAVMTVSAPPPKGGAHHVYYDLEVCDPTQGDKYIKDGVDISNFVGRSYFGMLGGSGKTNFLNLPLKPFGVRPKGYFQYEDGVRVHQVNGEEVTQEMRDAKALMKNGRRNKRREERLK